MFTQNKQKSLTYDRQLTKLSQIYYEHDPHTTVSARAKNKLFQPHTQHNFRTFHHL